MLHSGWLGTVSPKLLAMPFFPGIAAAACCTAALHWCLRWSCWRPQLDCWGRFPGQRTCAGRSLWHQWARPSVFSLSQVRLHFALLNCLLLCCHGNDSSKAWLKVGDALVMEAKGVPGTAKVQEIQYSALALQFTPQTRHVLLSDLDNKTVIICLNEHLKTLLPDLQIRLLSSNTASQPAAHQLQHSTCLFWFSCRPKAHSRSSKRLTLELCKLRRT